MDEDDEVDDDESQYQTYFYTLSALAFVVALCSFGLLIRLVRSTERSRMPTRKIFFFLLGLTMLSRCAMWALEPTAHKNFSVAWDRVYLSWWMWTGSLFNFTFFVLLCAWADFYFLLNPAGTQSFIGPYSLSTVAVMSFALVLFVECTAITIVDGVWATTVSRQQALHVGTGIFLTCCILAISVAFLIFGGLLVKLLINDSAGMRRAVKVGSIALVVSLTFLAKGIFQIIQLTEETQQPTFQNDFALPLVYGFIAYLFFEIIPSALMLLLMQGIPRVSATQTRVSKYTPLIQGREKDLSLRPSSSTTTLRTTSYTTSAHIAAEASSSTDSDDLDPGSYRLLSGSYDNSLLLEISIPEHR